MHTWHRDVKKLGRIEEWKIERASERESAQGNTRLHQSQNEWTESKIWYNLCINHTNFELCTRVSMCAEQLYNINTAIIDMFVSVLPAAAIVVASAYIPTKRTSNDNDSDTWQQRHDKLNRTNQKEKWHTHVRAHTHHTHLLTHSLTQTHKKREGILYMAIKSNWK